MACAATMAVPAAASAATKTVYEGAPPKAPAILQTTTTVNDFFLHKVTIHQGDSVKWINTAFHDVDLPRKGGKDLPLIAGHPPAVTGVKDAAGVPFWFNGLPSLGFNVLLLGPSGPTTYDGSTRVDSGLALGPPKPFTVTFTKAGTYKYQCTIHPGMEGEITVK